MYDPLAGVWYFCHSGFTKKNRWFLMIGPPSEKPYWRWRNCVQIRLRAREVLAARVAVDAAVKLVRAALGDGVDEEAAEVALAHVERREQNLVFLHRVERDGLGVRLATRLAGGAESEHVARRGAVDLDGVLANVHAAAGEVAGGRGDLRNERDEVREVAVERRKTAKQRIGDRGRRSGLGRRDDRARGGRGNADSCEHRGLLVELDVAARRLAQRHAETGLLGRGESDAARRNAVRATDLEA